MPINEVQLTEYALGILDQEGMKRIQQQVDASPALQNELVSIQDALLQVALAEQSLKPSEHLRNRVLKSIQEKTRFDGFIDRFAELFDLDKLASRNLLFQIDHDSGSDWETTPFPGVEILKFVGGPKVVTATCGIVRVKQGKLFPAHQHQGDETILVLQGTARDDCAKEITVGDKLNFWAGSRHSFRIVGDETFVFAVVLQKENKWLLFKTLVDFLSIKK